MHFLKKSFTVLVTFALLCNTVLAAWTDTKSTGDAILSSDWNSMVQATWDGSSGDVYRATGSVGIGTTDPNRSLQIHDSSGAGYLQMTSSTSGVTATDGLEFSIGTDASVWNYETGYLRFGTANAEWMRILADGKVGIGSTAPTTALDVTGTVTATAFAGPLTGNATTATDTVSKTGIGSTYATNTSPTFVTPTLGIATGTSLDLGATTLLGSRALTIDTGGVFDIALSAAAGDDFTVDTNKFVVEGDTGNVGVGTTAPTGLLDVRGTLCLNGGADCRSTWPATDTNIWTTLSSDTYYTAGNVGIGITAPTSTIHGVSTLSVATGNEIAYTLDYTTNKATSGNDTGLKINMTDTASPGTSYLIDAQVGGASKFYVDNAGVANTTTLSIGGTPVTSTAAELNYVDGVTSALQTQLDAKEGTLTNSAGLLAALSDETGTGVSVFGTSPTLVTPTFTTSATAPLLIGGTATTSDLNLQTTSATGEAGADMHFLVGNAGATEALTILNDGNVGIGNTAPAKTLDVTGDINFTGTLYQGGVEYSSGAFTDGTTLAYYTAGNVGIGTTVPQSLFDIQGPIGTGVTGAGRLTLATKELTIVAADELGRINFNAPLATPGTDAILPGASIWAVAEDTFSTSVNSTSLILATGTSEAAAEKVRITAAGNVGIGTTAPGAKLDISGGSIQTDTQLISTLAIGTAPLAVTSTTLVANLNADLLDGLDSSAFGDSTLANQTTMLTKIGANDDAATLSGSLFAGQEYLAAGQTSITTAVTDEVLDFVATGCSDTQEMQLRWNTSNAEPEWVCPDTTPNAFDFTDQTIIALSTLTESNILTITGIDVASLVTVSGDGSPEFRICNDSSCSVVDHSWGNNNQNIDASQAIQLRLTSNAAGSTANTASLAIGGGSDNWIVTTGDVNPTSFDYTDQTAVALSTLTESNILQITGLTMATAVSISGDGTPNYRICSDSACSSVAHTWSASAGSIDNNEYLQLRLTSNAVELTANSASIVVGEGSDSWSVTTGDTTPAAFNYTDQTGVLISTLTESNILQITGLTASTVVSISGTGTPAYRICSTSDCGTVTHTWSTSAGSIDNNEYLQLRLTSNASVSTANSASMVVGTGSDSWSVTTGTYMTATGGTITTDGNYKIHTFTSSGTFTVTNLGGDGTVDALVVAGGGGGGEHSGAGGGAGGLLWETSVSINSGDHTVTVGAGGPGSPSDSTAGVSGDNSIFTYNTSATLTAIGGGGGGHQAGAGLAGGSGGGSARNNNNPGSGSQPASTDGGYGNAGGGCVSGCLDPNYPGHGGGGAGAAGAAGDQSVGGVGGDGHSTFITDATTTAAFLWAAQAGTDASNAVTSGLGSNPGTLYIAGGGGGSMQYNSAPGGAGGKGGGANGGAATQAGANAPANTGGGGGGSSYTGTGNANGGSGIVIIRYQYQ